MIESWTGRLSAIAVLVALLVVLLIGYGGLSPAPALGWYPSEDELAKDGNQYTDTHVVLRGTVVQTDPLVIKPQYEYYANGRRHGGVLRFKVQDASGPVTPGNELLVFGSIIDAQTIRAERTRAIPASNYMYMYTVSALAGFWVLGRLIQGWTLDRKSGGIMRRQSPIRIRDAVKGFREGCS